jgi:hypothetical protein
MLAIATAGVWLMAGAWAAERAPAAMADKPVSPGIASSAQGPTLGSSALPSDPRFSPISLRRLLPPRLLGAWAAEIFEFPRKFSNLPESLRLRYLDLGKG